MFCVVSVFKNVELKSPALLHTALWYFLKTKNFKIIFHPSQDNTADYFHSKKERGVIHVSRAKGQSIVNCFYVYLWEHYAKGDTALACKMVILATPKHNLNRTDTPQK